MIPASEIDEVLLSFCNVRWLKVARIIGKAQQTFEDRGVRVAPDELDARMAILVRTRQWEAKGNIQNWRYSEVCLPIPAE
jgi:Protein of unknown function